jgi:hypothetical protein
MEPVSGSFVVIANVFNPSIVSQAWLLSQGLVDEAEFGQLSLSTPQVAQHAMRAMDLLVAPERLQLTFPPADGAAPERAARLAREIIEKLPHTPYTAVGMNFDYGIDLPGATFAGVLRTWFLAEQNPLAARFECDDARFGGYFSKNLEDMRLKLIVLPLALSGVGERQGTLRFQFNFHRDLSTGDPQEAARQAGQKLSAWRLYRDAAVEMVQEVERNVNGRG